MIDGTRPQQLVAEFHEIYDLPDKVKLGQKTTVDHSRIDMRMALISEEFGELCGAIYGEKAKNQIDAAVASLEDAHQRDPIETADALADLVYVVYGMALECGIDLDQVLAEVHSSNLSKLMPDGTVKRREDGKVLKGPDFREPNIAQTLNL